MRGILARALDRRAELLRDGFGETAGGSFDHSLELVELAPLDVREAGLDPLDRLGLLGRDALAELTLALAEPVGDLVQRAAPVALVRLELLVRTLSVLARGLLELGPESG